MKKFIDLPVRIILMIAGFLFVFNLPFLLGIGRESIVFRPKNFWEFVKTDINLLLKAADMEFIGFLKQLGMTESYGYTMTLLISSLIIVIIFALVIAILVLIAPYRISHVLKRGINFFEAIPDLMVIFFLQYSVIMLYKTTGLKFLQLYGVFGAKPYVVPIITISFLPLFLLTQFLIKIISEEQSKIYALYGTAKGLSRIRILLVHILRNVFPFVILQLRTVMWVILSSIYLIEFMFNLPGFTRVFEKIIFLGGDIVSMVICLLIFTFPLIIIEALIWVASRRIHRKEAVGI